MVTLALILLCVLALAGACVAALRNHVLHAIFGLGCSVVGIAGVYLWLGSPFVAAMLVLIYIGGISVAMVFAMMLSVSMSRKLEVEPEKVVYALVAAAFFALGVGGAIWRADFKTHPPHRREAWKTEHVGHALLKQYNIPFETLSVVLLLAIIGAIAVARQDPGDVLTNDDGSEKSSGEAAS